MVKVVMSKIYKCHDIGETEFLEETRFLNSDAVNSQGDIDVQQS